MIIIGESVDLIVGMMLTGLTTNVTRMIEFAANLKTRLGTQPGLLSVVSLSADEWLPTIGH